jgi:hypothetical protein
MRSKDRGINGICIIIQPIPLVIGDPTLEINGDTPIVILTVCCGRHYETLHKPEIRLCHEQQTHSFYSLAIEEITSNRFTTKSVGTR